MSGLTLDFRQKLPVVTHHRRRIGKTDRSRGMYCCLVGLMGPPWSLTVDMGDDMKDGDEVGGWVV